ARAPGRQAPRTGSPPSSRLSLDWIWCLLCHVWRADTGVPADDARDFQAGGGRDPSMAVALGVFAHPDDMEFVAAGTLLRLQRVRGAIHSLAVANGSCGSSIYGREELVSMRRAEAQDACRLVGFTRHESLVGDFEVFYERGTLAKLAALVRRIGPDILLTHSPSDYMEDHENA